MKVKTIPNNFFNKLDLSSPKLLKGIKFAQKNPNQLEYIKSLFNEDMMNIFGKNFKEAEELSQELLELKTKTNVVVQNTIMQSYMYDDRKFTLADIYNGIKHDKVVEQLSLNL